MSRRPDRRPVYDYVVEAQKQGVTGPVAWKLWRTIFPRATSSVFNSVWNDVRDARSHSRPDKGV